MAATNQPHSVYVVNHYSRETLCGFCPGSYDQVGYLRLISQGSAPNLMIRFDYHLVRDASCQVTLADYTVTVDCRG